MSKLSKIVAILAGVATLFPCGSGAQSVSESFALFDNFTYEGKDVYYEKHPLTKADEYYNPILPGWYSDPSICRVGEDYFMVTSTFSYYPGIPIFHSKDLLNWRQIGHVLNRSSQLNLLGQAVNNGGIYAPAISYNPHNKTFYVVTTDVGKGNFFVKTTNPYGDWSDPIMLPTIHGIDPSFFFDDDGKAYILNNDTSVGTPEYDGHRTIRIQEFDPVTDKTIGERRVVVDKGACPEDKPIWIEGPHLYKINNRYYLMSAEGGTGDGHSEVIFTSRHPFGPFVPASQNPILTQRTLPAERPNPVTCAGHADLVQTPRGDWYSVFLACRPCDGQFENLGRETFLLPVRWTKDSIPYLTKGDETIPLISRIPGAKRQSKVTFGNFSFTDDFQNQKLGVEWMTLRNSATNLYSLRSHPGSLTLRCTESKTSGKGVPAFIGRRIQHHRFDCMTAMDFSNMKTQSAAGVLLFKNETRQYFFCVEKMSSACKIALKQIGENGTETVLAEKFLPGKQTRLNLKVTSDGLTFGFAYMVKSGKWNTLKDGVDAGFLSTRQAGGFTGTTIGMYAVQYY